MSETVDDATAAQPSAQQAPDSGRPDWVVVQAARDAHDRSGPPRLRTVLIQLGCVGAVVVVAVAVVGALISRRTAENQSVHEAAQLTNVIAEDVVQPELTDAMATSTVAAARLDRLIRERVLSDSLVRVKIWSLQGRILYSDEPRLVGQSFQLEPSARDALSSAHPQVIADISDLSDPENVYEKGRGTLLEVHRPIWTPSGRPVLFETYLRYDQVSDRAAQLWRGFAGITLSSIAAVVVLLVPLGWALVARARRAHLQREAMLQRAMDASLDERRRIAATLHDGVVQELAAASFTVAGNAQEAAVRGDAVLAERLGETGAAIRTSIGSMRSLLVDLYPPNLHSAGLDAALHDLAAGLRIDVSTNIDDDAAERLTAEQTETLFRMAQECLRNAAAHSRAGTITLTLRREADGTVLEVADDGVGFDPGDRPEGHFGLALLDDLARDAGAELALRTAPGHGTSWRMRLPA